MVLHLEKFDVLILLQDAIIHALNISDEIDQTLSYYGLCQHYGRHCVERSFSSLLLLLSQ